MRVGAQADLRKHERVDLDISIRVYRDAVVPTVGRAHDIGCGGMSFYAPVELPEKSQVKLGFELPNSRMRFGVMATVQNKIGYRYGVKFTDLSPIEAQELERVTRIIALTTGA